MGVHETNNKGRTNVSKKMSRDRSGSDYSENASDVTTCSCMASSVEKCSLRGCGGNMFQEPFFLHPPGSRPRDGIYINPMSAYINEPQKPKDMESFYLHSPHDLVYTRITHLFNDVEKPRNGVLVSTEQQRHVERKDETLTVKVDVHINNGGNFGKTHPGNGHTGGRPEITRETPSEHAYEQICLRQEETSSVGSSSGNKKIIDNASDSSRSRKTNRRYSRSSSASESSNMSSEIHCFSSTTSTPSLSRNSSNERINKPPTNKINAEVLHERKESPTTQVESEKEIRPSNTSGPGFAKPPPPPPPPPPDREDVVVLVVNSKQNGESNNEKKDGGNSDNCEENKTGNATNKSDVSCGEHQQPEVPPASPPADVEEIKTIQSSHLINRHMVLPFIPPKFANAADSDTLLKPSEYLKSICKNVSKNTLSKARSVDNLDCQGRDTEEEEERQQQQQQQQQQQKNEKEKESPPGPPPPPLSPLQKPRGIPNCNSTNATPSPSNESENSKSPQQQPLATISIQDLTSIQLRRTNTKMNATKTFSAPPPRSASMTNVSEPFFVQKTDLIAELKRTKDIPGIKKLKVERAQVEKTQEQNLISEISKAFNVSNFVDQIPEKDSSGNVIPIWKRQMLARKAAERAKKELEEQIARENEERRQKAIPPWKRQLLAKKDNEDKKSNNNYVQSNATNVPAVKIEIAPKRDVSPATTGGCNNRKEEKNENNTDEKGNEPRDDDSDDGQIIPWRAQLRKTNSKLNILD
ncbi:J domain-containing protein DDB_G0295729 [Polistes fuscatus]|uniref:J domain-containing protein DDB_G0295729 n=1 Tax=Polistes fuscatus TaxID=30207 RepID=UPI001CA9C860|nr:J domain-containing protein DDB_G0295729 [Polistes fuscatus]XP_043504260.1 J domain-containing protein DDB_G0295729 [Polistes fuscatus]XP_043504261.1 J domain-containing protein DDB_G0295729 [Polistes fuscatus]